jgi:hypothetical protein
MRVPIKYWSGFRGKMSGKTEMWNLGCLFDIGAFIKLRG